MGVDRGVGDGMKIFRHRDGDPEMERIALGGAAVKDNVAGNRAFGHMDRGASGAAEGDRGCDVADGGAGNMGGGLKMSNSRKRRSDKAAWCHSGRMAIRAISWPATSSMTTWPGSSRPDSRATMVAAGMPMSVATTAAVAVPMASAAGAGCRIWAVAYQSSTAA